MIDVIIRTVDCVRRVDIGRSDDGGYLTLASHKIKRDPTKRFFEPGHLISFGSALREFENPVTIGNILTEAEIEYVPDKTYYNGILVSEKMLKGPVDGKFGAAQMIMVVE